MGSEIIQSNKLIEMKMIWYLFKKNSKKKKN